VSESDEEGLAVSSGVGESDGEICPVAVGDDVPSLEWDADTSVVLDAVASFVRE
jgi:hypothetical protein